MVVHAARPVLGGPTVSAVTGTRRLLLPLLAVALVAASLAGVVGGHSASAQGPQAPIGALDEVSVTPAGRLMVRGWAYDADVPRQALEVHVYVDGRWGGALTAGQPRADLTAVLGIDPAHGYSGTVGLPVASGTACAYAIAVPPGDNPLLGCRQVGGSTPAQPTIGAFDEVDFGDGAIRVRGWAYDGDAPTTPLDVHAYVGGSFVDVLRADRTRPDLTAVLGIPANHGFDASIAAGPGEVCLYAIGLPAGQNPLLACKAPEPGRSPVGALDEATLDGTSLRVRGWAYDPDAPSEELTAEVVVDGSVVAQVGAGGLRPDLTAALGIPANHGFERRLSVSADAQEVCIRARDATGDPSSQVGCRRFAGAPTVLVTPTGVPVPILEARPGGWLVSTPCDNTALVSGGTTVSHARVVVDAGHGGFESGAVGPNGVVERNINLTVALRVEQLLEARGIDVQQTRTSDHQATLKHRADIANALGPDLFVSIHHNGGAVAVQPTPGTQILVQGTPESRRAGGVIYEELFAAASQYPAAWVGNVFDGVVNRRTTRNTEFYGLLRRTPELTSVITEWMYLSNASEAALLARPDVLEAEAQAIVRGVLRFLGTNDPGSGFVANWIDDTSNPLPSICIDPRLQ